jgi:hypothetical protein
VARALATCEELDQLSINEPLGRAFHVVADAPRPIHIAHRLKHHR